MILTNNFGLPQPLLTAHDQQRDRYNAGRGDARMSITQLLNPPQINILRREHEDEIEDDVSQRTWAMMGTAIHQMLEEACKDDEYHLSEERIEVKLDGWKISGQIDVQVRGQECEILDWKFTSSWKYRMQNFKDWEEQLNCYAYLVRQEKGWDINSMSVIMFVRDFMNGLAKTQKDYPPAPVVKIDIPLWSMTKQREFLSNRIAIQKDAERAHTWGMSLPECTNEERWKRDSDWAAMKGDNKRASKVGKTHEEISEWINKQNNPDEFKLIEREDNPTRCEDKFCSVSAWCQQCQKENADG